MNSEESVSARFSHALIADGIVVKINKRNLKLLSKIEIFKRECEKREISLANAKECKVFFYPRWDVKYGFVYKMRSCEAESSFSFDRMKQGFTFEELIQAVKEKIPEIKRARHNLACLIRLKNKLGLPGPIQKIVKDYDKGWGDYLKVLPQEEIDSILKY